MTKSQVNYRSSKNWGDAMFFTKIANIVKTRGLRSLLFLFLYKIHVADLNRLGRLAERLKLTAKLDGTIIHFDNPFTAVSTKGELMLGKYEAPERKLARLYLPKEMPVIELGASLGVVSCVVNRRLQNPKEHVVVEANPELLPYLAQNRDFNHCQFLIENAAIAYNTDYVSFFPNEGNLGGSIYQREGDSIQVSALTLQALAEKVGFHNFNLVCDIEGSEVDLFTHEMDFLRKHAGWIMVELHEAISGKATVDDVIAQLRSNGFELIEQIENTYCYRNGAYSLEQTEKRRVVQRGSV